MAVIEEVTAAYEKARGDQAFLDELDRLQRHYSGRPSPLYEASRLSEHAGGARIFLKREDLNHTGSHKINNVLGQALLARQMGKTRVIAETGAGQHGVATATACALLGLECVVYMGAIDTARQALNVARCGCSGGSGVGGGRVEDAEGRHQRGVPRLGHQRRQHVLLLRHRGRPASVSDDGARLSAGHRAGDPGADCRKPVGCPTR